MSKEPQALQPHPEGEDQTAGNQPTEVKEILTSLDTFGGKIHVRWSPEAAVSSLGLLPYRVSQDQWTVRPMGGGLPSALYQRQRAFETEFAGNHPAVGTLGPLALRPHQRDPWRWHQSGIVGHERGGERGFGTARDEGVGRSGKRSMAETAPQGQL